MSMSLISNGSASSVAASRTSRSATRASALVSLPVRGGAAPGIFALAGEKHGTRNAPHCAALKVKANRRRSVAAFAAAAPDTIGTPLKDLVLKNILTPQGLINPPVAEGSEAYVFAIYDEKQKVQYVGFSKDLRNSLRTVFSRRPDKAYYFKSVDLPKMDQTAMISVRDEWFKQLGGAPSGNKLALERDQWQKPVDAGAISQRGKQGAAEEQARQLMDIIRLKGCKEEFIANPNLLAEGLVDFLAAKEITAEEIELQRVVQAELQKKLRSCHAIVDGQLKGFQVLYKRKYPTNGGFMFDVKVVMDGKETDHRIVVGKGYYEPYGIEAEAPIEAALALLLGNKMPRHTDGLLLSSQFPVNYFSVSGLEQWFGDLYPAEFYRCIGVELEGNRGDNFWRWNKIHDYGPMGNESAAQLKNSIGSFSDWGDHDE